MQRWQNRATVLNDLRARYVAIQLVTLPRRSAEHGHRMIARILLVGATLNIESPDQTSTGDSLHMTGGGCGWATTPEPSTLSTRATNVEPWTPGPSTNEPRRWDQRPQPAPSGRLTYPGRTGGGRLSRTAADGPPPCLPSSTGLMGTSPLALDTDCAAGPEPEVASPEAPPAEVVGVEGRRL
jgi:hypothetical protein